MTPDSILLVLRFLRFAAAILLWGGGVYLLCVAPAAIGNRLRTRLSLLPAAAAVALAAATVLKLPVTAASFGDGWPDAKDPAVLGVVLGTWVGIAWMVDAGLCVVLAAGVFLLPRLRAGADAWPAATVLAGMLLVASAMTGHAAIGAGSWSAVHQANDALHLLAAGFWLGALPPLAATLRHEGAGPDARHAVERFAVAGQAAVAIVLATGVTNAVLIKGGTPLRWSSAYDVLLAAKIAVVLAMIGVACFNHFRLLPRLEAGSNRGARALRHGVLIEVGLGAIALGLVTIFGVMDAA